MADEIRKCPLCGWDANISHLGDIDSLKCEMCGEFKIVRSLLATPFADPETQEVKELLPYLRAHTRQASVRGDIVTLNTMNWKDFALSHKNTPFLRKVQMVLDLIASRCEPGTAAAIHVHADAPLVDANSDNQFFYLIGHLEESGYIKGSGQLRAQRQATIELTPKAWELRERNAVAGIPGKCFVAMYFDDSVKDAYDSGIFPAVKIDCKMEPIRLDLVPHNDNIVDKIISEIRSSQFMVADFTGHRGGVYFEAGFAKGLGREVIWTCKEDDFENVHFDIAQFSHIIWKDPADLRDKLAYRIKATIPGAV